MRRGVFLLVMMAFLAPAGCATTAEFVKSESYAPPRGRRIAVLPFSGDPQFRRPAAEWFAHRLGRGNDLQVTGPAAVELALKRAGRPAPQGETDAAGAKALGELLSVDLLADGSVTMRYKFERRALAVVRLIDARTGTVLAISRQTGATKLAIEEQPHVEAAIEASVEAILAWFPSQPGEDARER